MDTRAPQVVQPDLEVNMNNQPDYRAKTDPYVNSYGPEVYHQPAAAGAHVQPQRRNPWGLSPLAFGLLVGGITAVIMAAALGGGIGGALASCNSKKSEYVWKSLSWLILF